MFGVFAIKESKFQICANQTILFSITIIFPILAARLIVVFFGIFVSIYNKLLNLFDTHTVMCFGIQGLLFKVKKNALELEAESLMSALNSMLDWGNRPEDNLTATEIPGDGSQRISNMNQLQIQIQIQMT